MSSIRNDISISSKEHISESLQGLQRQTVQSVSDIRSVASMDSRMHTIDKAKGIKSSSREFLFFHRQIERQRSRCCYIDTYILHRHIEGNRSRSCTYLYMKERCIQIFLEIEIASHIYSTYIQIYIYIECSMSNNLQYFRMDSNAKCKWKEN